MLHKETYENMEVLLEHIKYTKYSWYICGDLKVVALLAGMQLRYIKLSCYRCESARESHYIENCLYFA